MKRFYFVFAFLASVATGCGQSDLMSARYGLSRSGPTPEFPSADPSSGAYVVVPADQRVFMVKLTSKQNDLEAQLAELISARDALQEALKSVEGLVAIRVADPDLIGQYPQMEKEWRGGPNALMAQVIFKRPADPLKQLHEFVQAVGKIKPAAGALWSIGLSHVASSLNSPEKYRGELIAKAMTDLQGLKSSETSRFRVSVTGLEKPLVVGQHSDNEFVVSLPYTVTVESLAESTTSVRNPEL